MFDLFRFAFQNLTRKKSRTWLTSLSMAVGVASVILISSIGAIGTQTVNREIDELGIGALTVSSNSLGADQIDVYKRQDNGWVPSQLPGYCCCNF